MGTYQAGDLAVLTVAHTDSGESRVRAVHVGNGWATEDRMFYPDDDGRPAPARTIVKVEPVVGVTLPGPHHAEAVLALLQDYTASNPQAIVKVFLGPLIEAYGRMARRAERARRAGDPGEAWPVSARTPGRDVIAVHVGPVVPPLDLLEVNDEWRNPDGEWRWNGLMFVSKAMEVTVNGVSLTLPEGWENAMWHPERPPEPHERWGWDNGDDHMHTCAEHVGDFHVCAKCHKTTPVKIPWVAPS